MSDVAATTNGSRPGGTSRQRATTRKPDLTAYFPIGEAMALLLHPHGEVVIHDLLNDRIAGIWNAFSERKVGDPSNLLNDPALQSGEQVIGPYEKAERDGSRVKSISAALRDAAGDCTGLLCVNFDMSKFDAAIAVLRAFTQSETSMPEVLFKGDLREQINMILRNELIRLNKSMGALTRDDRLEILAALDEAHIFQGRNSVPIVASILGVSRPNLYHMLRDARER